MKSARTNISALRQIVELIPCHLVKKLSVKYGIEKLWRTFDPWSHVVALMYGQLSHAFGLNDISDALENHANALKTVRGAVPPSRNGFSNANTKRDGRMAEELFWSVFTHLQALSPGFGKSRGKGIGFLRKFKRRLNIVDSTTIPLIANCISWAKHRRRKAAVKCHMRLDFQSFLPRFAVVDTANHSDASKAYELCAKIEDGEIVVFDKAYVDFVHLNKLDERGVFWVTRAKDNMKFELASQNSASNAKIVKDEMVKLSVARTRKEYSKTFRRITAIVEVDKKEIEMTFITNNAQWSATTICELYKARWDVEVFFKQMKQNLQLSDFYGNSQNAILWQIWTAMLVYLLLRFLAYASQWKHSFSRLFAVIRAILWSKLNIYTLLKSYGTAGAKKRARAAPEQAYLPGFSI